MKFYRLSDATFYDRSYTIYQFIKPFLGKRCLFLRNMEPLRVVLNKMISILPEKLLFFCHLLHLLTYGHSSVSANHNLQLV